MISPRELLKEKHLKYCTFNDRGTISGLKENAPEETKKAYEAFREFEEYKIRVGIDM